MKKIMFSTKYGLEQAVLERKKTTTRRLITLPDGLGVNDLWHPVMRRNKRQVYFTFDCVDGKQRAIYPQYQIGEKVAVAQSYHALNKAGYLAPEWLNHTCKDSAGYENKMFVRADLMPHGIRITNIMLQRLQDISDDDCIREGVIKWMDSYIVTGIMQHNSKNNICFDTPRQAFATLIDHICGNGTWQLNPWTFAYEFELIKF